jgi:hypothetical protein
MLPLMSNHIFKGLHLTSLLLIIRKAWLLLKNMIRNLYILFFELPSSFTNDRIWSWLCTPSNWWKLQFRYLKTKSSEPMKKLVNRKLLIFKRYQVDFNKIECFFYCGGSMKSHLTIDFLTHQILTIMGSKIETQRILF